MRSGDDRNAQSDAKTRNANRSTTPANAAFASYISSHWAERTEEPLPVSEQAAAAAARRELVAKNFEGVRLIIPAGNPKQRSNDTDYPFRAHSAFAHLTGWGSESEPGAVLVLESDATGHKATLFFRERAGRDSDEFYANPAIGEFWVGPRPSLAQVTAALKLDTAHVSELSEQLAKDSARMLVVREADPEITALVDRLRSSTPHAETDPAAEDARLATTLSELRLVKDDYELAELEAAIASTKRGFEDIIAALPEATSVPRGERVVEGVFAKRARIEGNEVGYGTIAASGSHACILHWTRNDGAVVPGELILVDAGIERDSYYTADITRTLPVSGLFTGPQRQVYEAVLEAADAAFAVVRPGIRFRQVHETAMAVIAKKCAEWGLLPVSAEESLAPDAGYHRRYMVHGTSHHLGLDVHDCAQARREMYLDGVLEPGMVFTIEPGLYFQDDDLTVPAKLRGIGVRIEDNIVVTANGARNLSADIPRTVGAVEAWMHQVWATDSPAVP